MIAYTPVTDLSHCSDIAFLSALLRAGDSNSGAACPDASFNLLVTQD